MAKRRNNQDSGDTVQTVVVSDYDSFYDLLLENGIIEPDTPHYEYLRKEDAVGKRVCGVVPMHIAAEADSVVLARMRIPRNRRGIEIPLDELRGYVHGWDTYRVTKEPLKVSG